MSATTSRRNRARDCVDAAEAKSLLSENISEKRFMEMVIKAAQYSGWTVFHDFDSRHSAPGFPDLVCVKEGAMVAFELKTERGRIRPEQVAWIDLLGSVPGVTAMIARPADWDAVLAVLQSE